MRKGVADGLATACLSPFRHALVLLLAAGIVSALTIVFIASRAATAKAPPTVLDNLALYANRGQPIHFCQTTRDSSKPTILTTACSLVTDLTPFQNRTPLLRNGEFMWMEFTGETLSMTELIRLWGRPLLAQVRENRFGLQWNLVADGLGGWMNWGEPHQTPMATILTLEALDGSGRIGPD